MKKLTLLLAATFFTLASYAGEIEKNTARTYSLSGQVTDIKTGEGLAGVKVEIENTEITIYTDFDGFFTVEAIYPGTYKICTSLISYKPTGKDLDIDDSGRIELSLEQL